MGNWEGNYNSLCVPLNDFDLILGINFFLKAKVTLLPYLGELKIMDESQTCLFLF